MRHAFTAGIGLTACIVCTAGNAQEPPRIEEMIVTAQKREQRLGDVPASLAVTSGDTLRRLNLNAATDLQYTSPGLGLGDSNTPRGAGFRVRGVGTQIFADGVEQSVGTVLDGIPLSRAGQGFSDLIDVERVEVLRGPQGMLFGRNASAGLINVVTRRPTDELAADGIAAYGTDDDVRLAGTLSGPVAGDLLGARGTGFFNSQDGFVRNVLTGRNLNDRKEYGFRGAVDATPVPGLEVLLRGDWSRRDAEAGIWTVRSLSTTSALRPFLEPEVAQDIGPQNRTVGVRGEVFNEVTSWGISAEISYDIGDHTLTSLTGYRAWDQFDNNDADQLRLAVLDINSGGNDLRQVSQELRIASPENDRFRYVGGLFFFQSDNDNLATQVGRWVVSFAAAQAAGANVPLSPTLAITPADLGGRAVDIGVDIRDLAAFGQLEFDILPNVTLIAGARLNDTQVQAAYARRAAPGTSALFNTVLGIQFAPLAYDLEVDDTAWLWRGGVQYRPADSLNLFFTASRGYKGPGFDTQVDFTIPTGLNAFQAAAIAPEVPTNYEIGYKGRLFDGLLDVSVVAYRTNFQDYQAQVFEVPPGAVLGSFRIRNAGGLRSQGVETEIVARPLENLTLSASAAFNDSQFLDFQGAACPRLAALVTAANDGRNCGRMTATTNAPAFDASGRPLNNAPRWTAAFVASYHYDLPGSLRLFVQPNLYFRDRISFGLYPDSLPDPTVQRPTTVLNLTAGIGAADGFWNVAFYAKNLTDTNFVTNIFDLPFGGPGDLGQFVTRDAMRTVGVQLRVQY